MSEPSESPTSGVYATDHIELASAGHPISRRLERARALIALRGVSVVYAMRLSDNLIKIGCTTNVSHRRKQLRGEVLAFMLGGPIEERAIHARLVDHRHHGREWYYPTPGVLAVINEMRDTLGLEPIAA
jgi:hypothetical protein